MTVLYVSAAPLLESPKSFGVWCIHAGKLTFAIMYFIFLVKQLVRAYKQKLQMKGLKACLWFWGLSSRKPSPRQLAK